MSSEYVTGFYGIPGRVGGAVHVFRRGIALCGMKPHRKAVFNWCAMRIELSYIECARCKERAGLVTGENITRIVAPYFFYERRAKELR